MMTALTRSATDRLRADFGGQLISPGDDGYDAARRVWNGAIDRRPALIAVVADTSDVAAAVRFARERGLAVSIRGGGHSAAGWAVADRVSAVIMVPFGGVLCPEGVNQRRTIRTARKGSTARHGQSRSWSASSPRPRMPSLR